MKKSFSDSADRLECDATAVLREFSSGEGAFARIEKGSLPHAEWKRKEP